MYINILAKVVTVLILYPDIIRNINVAPISALEDKVNSFFKKLENNIDYNPPAE